MRALCAVVMVAPHQPRLCAPSQTARRCRRRTSATVAERCGPLVARAGQITFDRQDPEIRAARAREGSRLRVTQKKGRPRPPQSMAPRLVVVAPACTADLKDHAS